jgi:hypothetical protein
VDSSDFSTRVRGITQNPADDTAGALAHFGEARSTAMGVVGLHRWEGRVIEIEGDIFAAELYPLDHDGPELVADFDLDLLAGDGDEILPGTRFYLTTRIIEYNGRKDVTSSLRLRRLGRWKDTDLRQVRSDLKG